MSRTKSKAPKFPDRQLFPRLLVATRPWSFPASLSPLLMTFTIMFLSDNLNLLNAVVFSVSIVSVQAAANLLNSYFDFERGLDNAESAGDRTMVDGFVTRKEMPYLLFSLSLIWFITFFVTLPLDSGLLFTYLSVYAAGFLLAILYSSGSHPLKYLGLGDLTVFMAFGPLLVVAAAWACAKDPFSVRLARIIFSTIPASILVVAILHANNHRDMKVDAKNFARTVAVRMGPQLSLIYYEFLVLSPAILSVLMALAWRSSSGMVAGGLTLPLGLRLVTVARNKVIPRDIDAKTAKLMLVYGVLTSAGIALVGQ